MTTPDTDDAEFDSRFASTPPISLTPEHSLAFWAALNEPVRLTPPQIELGRLMRGG